MDESPMVFLNGPPFLVDAVFFFLGSSFFGLFFSSSSVFVS